MIIVLVVGQNLCFKQHMNPLGGFDELLVFIDTAYNHGTGYSYFLLHLKYNFEYNPFLY